MKRFFITLAMMYLVAGCAAIGPTSSPEFATLVRSAVPQSEGEIPIVGSGNWFPNTRGFTPFGSTLLARPQEPIPGALAVAERSIVFMQWDDATKRFEPIKRIRFSDIESATLDALGINRRLIIRKTDLSVDSFDFTQAGGNFIDAPQVERAVHFIQSKITRKDSP